MWTYTVTDDNAFQSHAPRLWNQLPRNIRTATSLEVFKKLLKTVFIWLTFGHNANYVKRCGTNLCNERYTNEHIIIIIINDINIDLEIWTGDLIYETPCWYPLDLENSGQ